jgi:eukaryotic-like serine/threonine-protein kinase
VIAAGQTLGNYRILHKIGTGGMGAVYLAEHPLIGKRVALKVIHRELANNRDVVSRFFQEARAVNKIGNEHIIEVHDFGVTADGDHFFIMEYLEGKTLASVLSQHAAVGVVRALHIGAQIASALAAAHAAGIVHRDLKPDNIMLMARRGDPDFVKVLDFGLAKVFSAATAVKTAAGVLLGTPQYMSPEACESKGDVDHRTDIYALGVLLFQMMTGVLPFDGETMGEVLVKQVTQLPPAPRGLNPAIPPSVEQILLRCLAKPLDARFPTMLQLREALVDPEAYLRGSPPIAPARSVGPGEALVDSKAAILGASQHKTWLAPAAGGHAQHTRIATSNPLPLPAPSPSLAGNPGAPTLIADGGRAPGKPPGAGIPPAPELKMNTMRIATPMGYSSRAPRKVWPVVLLMALLLGLVGGAFSVLWFGPGSAPARSDAIAAEVPDAGGEGSGANAPATGSEAAVIASAPPSGSPDDSADGSSAGGSSAGGSSAGAASGVNAARLSIDSAPTGASVIGPDGVPLGKTPLKIEWPISDLPVTFELRLGGYKRKLKQTVVNGNTALRVELERAPVVRRIVPGPSGGSAGSQRAGSAADGLMRP